MYVHCTFLSRDIWRNNNYRYVHKMIEIQLGVLLRGAHHIYMYTCTVYIPSWLFCVVEGRGGGWEDVGRVLLWAMRWDW